MKLNMSEKGKAWRLEISEDVLSGKAIGDKISGIEVKPELEGYELEITGGSDSSGFPLSKDVEGIGLKKLLLKKGWGMKDSRAGMRLRKTVRGKVVSATTSQLNAKVLKAGKKPFFEIFPEQNKAEQSSAVPSASTEGKAVEESKAQDKKEEKPAKEIKGEKAK